jgi:hypothetical protein
MTLSAKIRLHDELLGGIARLTLQIDLAARPHVTPMRAIQIIGTSVAPASRGPVVAAA